jgi:short-subunit dehydrogenase
MKIAFITGASSGIGQALAQRFHDAGYTLALVARRTDVTAQWARSQGLDASRWRVFGADVRDVASITAAGQRCVAELGVPDVVVANAGVSIGMDTAELADIEVMRATFETNNIGMAATFQPFIQPMLARGSGTLVGIASVAGIRGLPGHGAYCGSKAAVISYCESLRGELKAASGGRVRVVTLLPGYIDTPLTRQNRYAMPFLMSAEAFADRAVAAIEAGASYRVIPWQMAWVAKLLRLLPNPVFDRLLAGRPRKHRASER